MGSVFSLRHNRWFGVHNPFGSDLAKAADPHVNLGTLKRLLNDPATRLIAVENLLNRGNLPALRTIIFETAANKDLVELVMQKAFSCLVNGNDRDFIARPIFYSSFNFTAERFLSMIGQLPARQAADLHELWGKIWVDNFGQEISLDKLPETEVKGYGLERQLIHYQERQTMEGILAISNRDQVVAYRVQGHLFRSRRPDVVIIDHDRPD